MSMKTYFSSLLQKQHPVTKVLEIIIMRILNNQEVVFSEKWKLFIDCLVFIKHLITL